MSTFSSAPASARHPEETPEVQTSKKTIRFLEDESIQSESNPQTMSLLNKSNTSKAISDSTHEDDIDFESNGEDSKFKHIKQIDRISFSGGESRHSEQSSPSSRRMDKSGTASSVQSGDENLSVHFGGEEIIDQEEPKFEYEPDDIPIKSILKTDLNRSRNLSFDVRILKDIEGKLISHENLSDGDDDNDEDGTRKLPQGILKDAQFMDQLGSGILTQQDSDEEENEDYLEEYEEERQYRQQRHDSEVRFKIAKEEEQAEEKPIDLNAQKRNSLSFPAYSILKNSPLVQPSEFKALKYIEKVSTYSKQSSDSEEDHEDQRDDIEGRQSDSNQEEVRFVGDIVLQDSNSYKFKYNPEENPKKPSIKRGSGLTGLTNIGVNNNTNTANASSEQPNIMTASTSVYGSSPGKMSDKSIRKRKSYDFHNLKNVEGKMIKHWVEDLKVDDASSATVEEATVQERDIKFGGIEILEQTEIPIEQLILPVNKTAKPQKPILKPMQSQNASGHYRSNSCDFKRVIKNIDGVYIKKSDKEKEPEEEEKIVHFSGEVNACGQQISVEKPAEQQFNSTATEETEKSDKKSILKRSMSLQGRLAPNMLSSTDGTPISRKSNFSVKLQEAKDSKDTPTPETFTANWTSIRNDYLESAYQFLLRLDPSNLSVTFPKGIDNNTFSQIIDVIYSKLGDNGDFVKLFMVNVCRIKNFSSLILSHQHLADNFSEILLWLKSNQLIETSLYHKLRSQYGLKF